MQAASSLGSSWGNATEEGTDAAQVVRALECRNHIHGGQLVQTDRVIFQGTATHWTCWELLTDALQVTGCQSCLQLWDQFLDNNDWLILSHWQNGICQQERSSELMADGDHVKGSPSGQTEMSMHASASVALCDTWHDAACPHFKQIQTLMYSFLWKLN